MAAEPVRRGRVSAFDDARGLGEVTAEGGAAHPFHCTAIADGTRTIEIGTVVGFVVRPGPMGRWEATALAPCGVDGPAA